MGVRSARRAEGPVGACIARDMWVMPLLRENGAVVAPIISGIGTDCCEASDVCILDSFRAVAFASVSRAGAALHPWDDPTTTSTTSGSKDADLSSGKYISWAVGANIRVIELQTLGMTLRIVVVTIQ